MDKKSYCVVIKKLDTRYSFEERFYRLEFKICNGFRELRDYMVKCDFSPNEYIIYESTDIKIKDVHESKIL